jgi:hypothetical protein
LWSEDKDHHGSPSSLGSMIFLLGWDERLRSKRMSDALRFDSPAALAAASGDNIRGRVGEAREKQVERRKMKMRGRVSSLSRQFEWRVSPKKSKISDGANHQINRPSKALL